MDIGNGFLKLQEENSRRSSVFRGNKELKGGLPYATRLNCGCGPCFPCRVKVEKDEGSLRIGRLTLAPNCHLILLVFGFCFLLAGAVLTALAYSQKGTGNRKVQGESGNSTGSNFFPDPELLRHAKGDTPTVGEEERLAGPLFVIIGFTLVFLGISLAVLGYRLNREAQRQRLALNRFPMDSPTNGSRSNHRGAFEGSPDFFFSSFSNLDGQDGTGTSRRSSFFGNSFSHGGGSNVNTRRSTLATIAQAVPVGFFMPSDSPRTPGSTSVGYQGNRQNSSLVTGDASEFQEIELSSPKKKPRKTSGILQNQNSTSFEDDEFNLPALTLRPSLPIPMFGVGMRNMGPLDPRGLVVSSRSDEPFGSIASLSTGTGDIACFPSVHYTITSAVPVIVTVPEVDEVQTVNIVPLQSQGISPDRNGTDVEPPILRESGMRRQRNELPPININTMGNALTATGKPGGKLTLLTSLKGSRSEDTPLNDNASSQGDTITNCNNSSMERRGSVGD